MNKTAMQELIIHLEMLKNRVDVVDIDSIIEYATYSLEKEKGQIEKAYKDHHDLGHIYGLDTEKYYKETYNNL